MKLAQTTRRHGWSFLVWFPLFGRGIHFLNLHFPNQILLYLIICNLHYYATHNCIILFCCQYHDIGNLMINTRSHEENSTLLWDCIRLREQLVAISLNNACLKIPPAYISGCNLRCEYIFKKLYYTLRLRCYTILQALILQIYSLNLRYYKMEKLL